MICVVYILMTILRKVDTMTDTKNETWRARTELRDLPDISAEELRSAMCEAIDRSREPKSVQFNCRITETLSCFYMLLVLSDWCQNQNDNRVTAAGSLVGRYHAAAAVSVG